MKRAISLTKITCFNKNYCDICVLHFWRHLPPVGGAIKNLFNDPSDAFYTGRIMDILFDGVPVDCSAKDQITGALCLTFEGTRGFRRVNDTHLAFSIFGGVSSLIFSC